MIKAGMARVDITPPKNVPMEGFDTRRTGSQGIHDPLYARSIVLDNGRARLGWLIADLIGLPSAVTAAIRKAAAERAGIPEDNLMVSATHTHGGPAVRPAPEIKADHDAHAAWLDRLPGVLVDALSSAAEELEPIETLYGRAVCADVQHNRRFHMKDGTVKMVWDNPVPADIAYLGPMDPAVQVLAFKSRDRLRGVIVQFACHATAVVGDNFLITADWPGVTCRELETKADPSGPWVAVAQGCCGNITPSPPRGTYEICKAKGGKVAQVTLRALGRTEPIRSETLAAARIPVRIPRKKKGLDPSPTGEYYPSEVQAFRIGDVAAVGLPGEAFAEIGLEIKAYSEFRGTLVGSYANDYNEAELGYIPIAAEYGGGYEAAAAGVAPGADAILIAAARRALEELGQAGGGT
jgi:neutral ceramidase